MLSYAIALSLIQFIQLISSHQQRRRRFFLSIIYIFTYFVQCTLKVFFLLPQYDCIMILQAFIRERKKKLLREIPK